MQKKDWVVQISQSLNRGSPFVYSSVEDDNCQLLFACDTFRRKNHDVVLNIVPSHDQNSIFHVVVHPLQTCAEFTLKKNDCCNTVVEQLTVDLTKIRIRGCGTATGTVLRFAGWAVNNGWYIEKTTMNTLTQKSDAFCALQKNTTLQIVLRRGSQPEGI